MSFELSEAYVQLSERGFADVESKVDSFEERMDDLKDTADKAASTVSGTLGDAVGDLSDKLDAATAKTDKFNSSLDGTANSDGVKGLGSEFSDVESVIGDAREGLERGREKIEDWRTSANSVESEFSDIAKSVGASTAKAGALAFAVKSVFDWVYKTSFEFFGLNDQFERSIDLTQKLGSERERIFSQDLKAIDRMQSSEEKLEALEKKRSDALAENAKAQAALQAAKEETDFGIFSGGGPGIDISSGKNMEELQNDIKLAEINAQSAASSLEDVERAIEKVKDARADLRAEIQAELNSSGDPETDEFDSLVKGGGDPEEVRKLLAQRKLRADAIEQEKEQARVAAQAAREKEQAQAKAERDLQRQQSMVDRMEALRKSEIRDLRLRNIALKEGEDVAERVRQTLDGWDASSIEEAARIRQENATLEGEGSQQSNAFQTTGITELATLMQQQAQSQTKSMEAKQDITNERLRIIAEAVTGPTRIQKDPAMPPPVDRRFGRS